MPKKILRKRRGVNPFGELLGLTFTKAENGISRCVLEVAPKLMNPQQVVHGGVAYSMADTGMGGALYSIMEENELCASVEINMVYFKPITSGTLTCNTKVIHKGKKFVTLESDVSNDGSLAAKALGVFTIFHKSNQ